MEKEKVVDRKEVIVQTEPVFIKSKDLKQEFKCRDCNENFLINRDLMTHRRAIHKEKVKICRKFAARIHCTFGSGGCWFIHKESGTNNILSETEF